MSTSQDSNHANLSRDEFEEKIDEVQLQIREFYDVFFHPRTVGIEDDTQGLVELLDEAIDLARGILEENFRRTSGPGETRRLKAKVFLKVIQQDLERIENYRAECVEKLQQATEEEEEQYQQLTQDGNVTEESSITFADRDGAEMPNQLQQADIPSELPRRRAIGNEQYDSSSCESTRNEDASVPKKITWGRQPWSSKSKTAADLRQLFEEGEADIDDCTPTRLHQAFPHLGLTRYNESSVRSYVSKIVGEIADQGDTSSSSKKKKKIKWGRQPWSSKSKTAADLRQLFVEGEVDIDDWSTTRLHQAFPHLGLTRYNESSIRSYVNRSIGDIAEKDDGNGADVSSRQDDADKKNGGGRNASQDEVATPRSKRKRNPTTLFEGTEIPASSRKKPRSSRMITSLRTIERDEADGFVEEKSMLYPVKIKGEAGPGEVRAAWLGGYSGTIIIGRSDILPTTAARVNSWNEGAIEANRKWKNLSLELKKEGLQKRKKRNEKQRAKKARKKTLQLLEEQREREEKEKEMIARYGPRVSRNNIPFHGYSEGETRNEVDRVIYYTCDDDTPELIGSIFRLPVERIMYDNQGYVEGIRKKCRLMPRTPILLPPGSSRVGGASTE